MDKIEMCQNEIDKKFAPKKQRTQKLVKSYMRMGEIGKSHRCNECGNWLEWRADNTNDERPKLTRANFCRDKLCPMCAWRRSMKLYNQLNRIIDNLCGNYNFIFVTLTIKNCNANELNDTIKKLTTSFTKMMKYKQFKNIAGYFRVLEITHDTNEFVTSKMWYGDKSHHIKSRKRYYEKMGLKIGDKNPSFDTYHPHLHCIFAVDDSYFQNVITQSELCDAWKMALNVDYTPICDIRSIKSKSEKFDNSIDYHAAICETAKYSVKSDDYLNGTDEMIDNTVRTLNNALHHVRLCSFGGVFKQVKQLLGIVDDAFDGDLLNISDDDKKSSSSDYTIIRYIWENGKYVKYIIPHICIDIYPDDETDKSIPIAG